MEGGENTETREKEGWEVTGTDKGWRGLWTTASQENSCFQEKRKGCSFGQSRRSAQAYNYVSRWKAAKRVFSLSAYQCAARHPPFSIGNSGIRPQHHKHLPVTLGAFKQNGFVGASNSCIVCEPLVRWLPLLDRVPHWCSQTDRSRSNSWSFQESCCIRSSSWKRFFQPQSVRFCSSQLRVQEKIVTTGWLSYDLF